MQYSCLMTIACTVSSLSHIESNKFESICYLLYFRDGYVVSNLEDEVDKITVK